MNVIQLSLFLIFPCCGVLCGHYLFSGIGGVGQLAGYVLGGAVGVILWLVACDLLNRKNMKRKENTILFILVLKGKKLKSKPVDELKALPTDSDEETLWDGVPVQLHTQCKKQEDGNFKLTLSVKFQEAGDTITYSREFVVLRQQEKST